MIPALGRLKQEAEASLGYPERPCLNNTRPPKTLTPQPKNHVKYFLWIMIFQNFLVLNSIIFIKIKNSPGAPSPSPP